METSADPFCTVENGEDKEEDLGKISKGKSPWPSVTSMWRIRRRCRMKIRRRRKMQEKEEEEEIGAG
jgi:hypothetical protein